MDFFAEASTAAPVSSDSSGLFAEAIAQRYASTGGGGVGPLSPALVHVPGTPRGERPPSLVVAPASMSFPPMELASMALASPPPRAKPAIVIAAPPPSVRSSPPGAPTSSTFAPMAPAELARVVDAGALVIDIRPPTAYSFGRVRGALGLAAPSTLIRRPAFTLDKLAAMVGPPSARTRFTGWASAPLIVAYDADSANAAPGSSLHGLLYKFQASGYDPSKLRWIKGGFQTIWAEQSTIVDSQLPPDEEETPAASSTVSVLTASIASPSGVLQTKSLTMSAFSLTPAMSSRSARPSMPTLSASSLSPKGQRGTAANPFFDNIRQNLELSGTTSASAAASGSGRVALRLPPSVARRVDDLPLPWLRDIAHRAEHERQIGASGPDSVSDALARQFYAVERAEQQRLQSIMDHHTKQGHSATDETFPFGITAGFEKGQKNRYRNIWPFEHARVRLVQHGAANRMSPADFDDYVNASYVQPLCTRKRYIATQGPLDATFADFWALVWEQNVHVIIMLTRLREGAQAKCGRYWAEGRYGRLRLRPVESTGTPAEEEGGFFAMPTDAPRAAVTAKGGTVRRVFELSHDDYPRSGPRRVTQLQYLGWDDMNVPEDAQGVLGLVRDVDKAVQEGERQRARIREHSAPSRRGEVSDVGVVRQSETAPVLLHCSAGIGRTGGFIALDAILDGIRSEVRAMSTSSSRPAPISPSRSRMGTEDARNNQARPTDPFLENHRPSLKRLVSAVGHPVSPERTHGDPSWPPARSFGISSGTGRSPPRTPAYSPTAQKAGESPFGLGSGSPFASAQTATSPRLTWTPQPGAPTAGASTPRALHQDAAPTPLSAFETPVHAVVDDMREQRMSLCQTLRQYVFVHMAILEGALEIVDEQRAGMRR